MRPKLTLSLAAASVVLATAVFAADHEAGIPLTPAEAAGAWTVENDGHAICMLQLSPDKVGSAGFGAAASGNCGDALPAGIVGWAPTSDGMALTGQDGKVLVPFNRWSNSLFVSHRSSGTDVQLMRGGPHPQG
jgi:hypothetical protein